MTKASLEQLKPPGTRLYIKNVHNWVLEYAAKPEPPNSRGCSWGKEIDDTVVARQRMAAAIVLEWGWREYCVVNTSFQDRCPKNIDEAIDKLADGEYPDFLGG
jgi:hypothetical protein